MRPAYWGPPVVWMAIIWLFSTDDFGGTWTEELLLPLLRWLVPDLTRAQLLAVHALLRKTAHFVEYAILAALWFRAFVHGRRLSARGAAWVALALSLAWALLDEAHQATTLLRTPSAVDVLIDAAGVLLALTVARRGWGTTLDGATRVLLWLATVGGALVLGVNWVAGVASGVLWLAVPAAALTLLLARPRRVRP
ncbi:MAG: VanZ family protein [Candidatus Rokubacteria bacterium]|nr:VanZ family protein [Candidatus Rokubacteria bacterium]